MSQIDWSKAPDWAKVVIAGQIGEFFWSPAWGGCQTVVGLKSGTTQYASMTGDHSWRLVEERQWNGEGLPPVGTVCEVQTWVNREWRKTTVLAHHLGFAVHSWSTDGDDMEVEAAPPGDFRPFRTPEQIAADELQREVQQIMVDAGITDSALKDDPEAWVWAQALYEAGYRKQVAP